MLSGCDELAVDPPQSDESGDAAFHELVEQNSCGCRVGLRRQCFNARIVHDDGEEGVLQRQSDEAECQKTRQEVGLTRST